MGQIKNIKKLQWISAEILHVFFDSSVCACIYACMQTVLCAEKRHGDDDDEDNNDNPSDYCF